MAPGGAVQASHDPTGTMGVARSLTRHTLALHRWHHWLVLEHAHPSPPISAASPRTSAAARLPVSSCGHTPSDVAGSPGSLYAAHQSTTAAKDSGDHGDCHRFPAESNDLPHSRTTSRQPVTA